VGFFEAVCQTLAYAHAHGVIHRDLKPANVMVGAFGEVQVMDWGLAKVLSPHTPTPSPREREGEPELSPLSPRVGEGLGVGGNDLSHAGSVLGTPAYMAPEQARGQTDQLDERTDVFGLGAILCEILTGQPPFAHGESSAAIQRSARGELGEAIALLDGCGAESELVGLARDCLAAEACDRPRDAGEVARRVTAYRAGVEQRLHQAEVERAAAQVKVQAEKRARHLTLVLALAALLLLALGGGSFAWWWMQRSASIHDVKIALAEARIHLQQGELLEARASLERASGRLGDGGPKELRERLRQAQADVALVDELEEIRLRQTALKDNQFDNAGADPLYAEALGRYGLDVSVQEEAVSFLRTSAIREALLAALHDWALVARDEDRRARLRHLLDQVDDDDWRWRFRTLTAGKAAGLKALARREDTLKQPATILTQLGQALAAQWPDETVRLFRRALRKRPADFWFNHNLGMALRGREKEEAVRFLTVAVVLRPKSPGALLNLGVALSDLDKEEEAIACYREAIALDPKYAHAHNNLGIVLFGQGKLDEAIEEYRKAIAFDRSCAPAHNNLGTALAKQGRIDEAIAAFRRSIEHNPRYVPSHTNLAKALHKQGKVDEAIPAYRKALALDPKNAPTHYNLGIALVKQDKLGEAITAYRRAIALDPKYAHAHNNLGIALAKQDKVEEAIAAFRRAIEFDPEYVGAHDNLGKALDIQGKLDEAIAEYRRAIQIDPKFAPAHDNLGTALDKQGKVDEAIPAYRRAVSLDPKSASAHYNLGHALSRQGKLDEGITCFRQALALDPKFVPSHYNLGLTLTMQGKLDEAIACYRQAIRLDTKHAEAHCNLGQVLKNQGRFAESLESLRRGHALGSQRPGWPYPSALWVRRVERVLRQEKQLPDVLSGKRAFANVGERLEYASLCSVTRRYAASVRLYAEAFTAEPALADNLSAGHRYNAARAAALAAAGKGKDAAKLDEAERSRLRGQALTWLRADLTLRRKQLASAKPAERQEAQRTLGHWQQDSDLAGLRGEEALALLPAGEREEWTKLWVDVETLRNKTR
jgi:tetratricopeptide (TPR) repeat protein